LFNPHRLDLVIEALIHFGQVACIRGLSWFGLRPLL
jgi:hypothetical protein